MDLHRLAEERSVAYHRAIAEKLRHQPEVLEKARRRVQEWMASDVSTIAAFLVERSELADELRQSTPFAGALDPRERWRIWRETRDRFSEQP
ncbi:MAG TPA: hypothetical protein VE685_14505 [Thermoanaerobaculia bacterium]|nr:hypothetical protein [Thermoanaerobaculia bacterium]